MRYVFAFLFLLPILTFSQVDKTLSIIETGKKLTGTWLLKTLEKDSLLIEQSIVGKKYLSTTKINGKLVKTEFKDGLDVIELSFGEYGISNYQEYHHYQIFNKKGDDMSLETCQPVPELIFKYGKIIIHMTYMLGEGEEEIIQLTENKLTLLSNTQFRRTFERLK
ncbi:MAG TPA: hypothetical protein VK172_13755 [Lentimicrobium sp.]|nr:hypothetical protein [Lentimicrobium sp.]